MSKLYVGLDEGSSSCYFQQVDSDGNLLAGDRIPTTDESIVSTFSSMNGPVHVMMEAATISGHIYYLLEPVVQEVIVCEPRFNKQISLSSSKGDPQDAAKLAELLRLRSFKEVWMPENKDRWVFRQLVSHYSTLTSMGSRVQSRLHARYLMNGVFDRGGFLKEENRHTLMDSIRYHGVDSILEQFYRIHDFLQEERQQAKQKMVQFSRRFPEIQRFLEVPGVGEVIASLFSAYIGNPHRFETNKQVRKYCSLAIRSRTSDGTPLGYEKLDRGGRSELKDATYKAALAAISSGENAIGQYYSKQLEKTGSTKKARLSTQRKVVDVLWNLWRKDEQYDPEKVYNKNRMNRTRELVIETAR